MFCKIMKCMTELCLYTKFNLPVNPNDDFFRAAFKILPDQTDIILVKI